MKEKETAGKREKGWLKKKRMVVLSYVRGVSNELVRIYMKRQITSAMEHHSSLRRLLRLLIHPKGKTDPKEGYTYTIDCAGCPTK